MAVIDFWPLTPREQQILTLFAHGMNQSKIGNQLEISRETVKWHSKTLRMKLGAKTIAHAVSMAYRQGALNA